MRMEERYNIPDIIIKVINGSASDAERKSLDDWISESDENRELFEKLQSPESIVEVHKEFEVIETKQVWSKIETQLFANQRPVRKLYLNVLKYAAIIMLPIVACIMIFYEVQKTSEYRQIGNLELDMVEASGFSLITEKGQQVLLDSIAEDSLFRVDATDIKKGENEIIYDDKSGNKEKLKYNTLITPKEKVFSVQLSDKTKIWLNANSAIKYPTRFDEKERKVYLVGEAYFEVSHNANKPFVVVTSNMNVKVLGTSFNVSAYKNDDYTQTSLIEGKVMVKTKNEELLLKPGEMAHLNEESKQLTRNKVDVNKYIAWRYGKCIFDYDTLEDVMEELSQWYGVKVLFSNQEIKNIHFTGTLNKYKDIHQTLNIIKLTTDVNFEVKEDVVVVGV